MRKLKNNTLSNNEIKILELMLKVRNYIKLNYLTNKLLIPKEEIKEIIDRLMEQRLIISRGGKIRKKPYELIKEFMLTGIHPTEIYRFQEFEYKITYYGIMELKFNKN